MLVIDRPCSSWEMSVEPSVGDARICKDEPSCLSTECLLLWD